MSSTIPVPRELVEEILGYGAADEPRTFGGTGYREIALLPTPFIELTLAQVGDLFRWAWADADEWFDPSELPEGHDPVTYALDCRIEAADRLRDLLLWAAGKVDPIFTVGPSRAFDVQPDGQDCVVLRLKTGLKLRYATLERVAGSKVLCTTAHWVLRRLDWLLPQEGRDPAFTPAVTETELREVCDVLTRLNGEVRRGMG